MKQDILREQKTLSQMKFNRFIAVRFSYAILFFINFLWLYLSSITGSVLGIIFSTLILLLCIPVLFEQIKVQSEGSEHTFWFNIFFSIQIIINLISFSLTLNTEWFSWYYPFINQNADNKLLIKVFLVAGISMGLLSLYKLTKIKKHTDRTYKKVINYQKYIDFI